MDPARPGLVPDLRACIIGDAVIMVAKSFTLGETSNLPDAYYTSEKVHVCIPDYVMKVKVDMFVIKAKNSQLDKKGAPFCVHKNTYVQSARSTIGGGGI